MQNSQLWHLQSRQWARPPLALLQNFSHALVVVSPAMPDAQAAPALGLEVVMMPLAFRGSKVAPEGRSRGEGRSDAPRVPAPPLTVGFGSAAIGVASQKSQALHLLSPRATQTGKHTDGEANMVSYRQSRHGIDQGWSGPADSPALAVALLEGWIAEGLAGLHFGVLR